MTKNKGFRFLAGPALIAALAVPLAGGCSAEDLAKQGDCSATAEGKAFLTVVTDLETLAGQLKVDVATACRNIAVAGGETVAWDGTGTPEDADVTAACDAAVKVIGTVKAAGSFSLVVEGEFKCEANVQAQASCTAECDASGSCTADVSAYCDPGELSVQCEGTCNVGAKCEGSPTLQVDCTGSCSGACEGTIEGGCEGTCSGTCEGTCTGKCDGADSTGTCAGQCEGSCSTKCTGSCTKPAASATCTGKCSGSCEVTAPDFKCSGTAKCTGGCTGTATAPTCTGEVKATCEAKAECKGSCQASAQAKATCTYPEIKIQAAATVDAALITALETELPKILGVAQVRGKAIVSILGQVTAGIKGAVEGSAACALKLQAFVEASASINVSVSASASVSGEASGGT